MRIIIDSKRQKDLSVHRLAEPSSTETDQVGLDGGAPSESLLQLVSTEVSEVHTGPESVDAINAGSPPQWLVEAIQAETSPGIGATGVDIDLEAPTEVELYEAPAPVAEPTPPSPDDLTRIEGIGPKISRLLQAAGIMTFAQLTASDVGRLGQILKGAGLALADPSTWPEQASLAAAGEWDGLKALQSELKGGRRV